MVTAAPVREVKVSVPPYREVTREGKLILNLHAGQSRAWLSKARFPVVMAGTQSGKTCFLPDWLNREIGTKGTGDYIIGTATFPLLELKLLPEFTTLFCDILRWGKYRDSDKMIISKDEKTRIIFFSAVNSESIESATAKAAVMDEAGQRQFRLATWEAVQRRLSLNQGRCLFGTTLYSLGWLKTEVYDRWLAHDPNYDVIQFDSTDNPVFPRAEYDRMKAIMPSWKFDMFYRGRYAKPAGLIYDAFDSEKRAIKRFPIPISWPIYTGHDFGGANPAAMFYARVKLPLPEGAPPAMRLNDFVAFKEYLPGSGYSAPQHVDEFFKSTVGRTVAKSAGGSHQEEEIRQLYRKLGWNIVEPPVREVETGISKVYALHKQGMIWVFNDLRNYLDEIMSYSRKLDEKYQPTDEIEDKSKYHLMDCERGVMSNFESEIITNRQKSRVTSYW